jgi:hypothetical protein
MRAVVGVLFFQVAVVWSNGVSGCRRKYPQKTGWGHTPAEWAVDYAVAARAKRLALTHHDPLRDDEAVDRVVEMCRRRASAAGTGLEVFAAAEGQELRFIERDAKTPAAARAPEPARKVGPHTILVNQVIRDELNNSF